MTSIHNIRRPAFWLLLTTLAAGVFFIVTDPAVGWVTYPNMSPLDALWVGRWGTWAGLAGLCVLLAAAIFLCTRKATPPTPANPPTARET